MKTVKQGAPEPFAALNRIPIKDNGEPLVDIRIYCPKIIVNKGVLPYVREGVARMINAAQASLPPGHRLKIHSALRTIELQSEIYWRHYSQLVEQHPTWPKSALRRANNKYFAAPDVKAPPGHCTGGAVDVTIVGPDGLNLDMTSPTTRWEAAYTYSTNISPQAYGNRQLLINTMFGAGFSNCRDEWWHYSYGDNAWAVRTSNKAACYGLAPPPANHTHAGPPKLLRRIVHRRPRVTMDSYLADGGSARNSRRNGLILRSFLHHNWLRISQ